MNLLIYNIDKGWSRKTISRSTMLLIDVYGIMWWHLCILWILYQRTSQHHSFWFDPISCLVVPLLCNFKFSKLGSCKERWSSHKRSRQTIMVNLKDQETCLHLTCSHFYLGNIFLSFYFIYTHLLRNHTLYVGCFSDRTISSSPQIISRISSTKKLISFILEFLDFFVYGELWKNNRIFCKCWRILLNTLNFDYSIRLISAVVLFK